MKVEFFLDLSGCFTPVIYFKLDSLDWEKFETLTPEKIELIWCILMKHQKARTSLLKLSEFIPGNKKLMLEQFIKCNWSRLDCKLDISGDDLVFENVQCPFKGGSNCPYKGQGIICLK
jgi:hypothetical protein